MEANPSQVGADVDALYQVAYDEAARALSEQVTAIDSLRGRAGFLLSAAAITTTVLSGQALAAGSDAIVWPAPAELFQIASALLVIEMILGSSLSRWHRIENMARKTRHPIETRPQLQPKRPSPMQPEMLGFSFRHLLSKRFWPRLPR